MPGTTTPFSSGANVRSRSTMPSFHWQLADFTTQGAAGDGVAEVIDELIADDLASQEGRLQRNLIAIGERSDGSEVTISPYGPNVLIAGPSGAVNRR